MKKWKQLVGNGARMLLAGAALHALSAISYAEDVEAAEFKTSSASRGKPITLISDDQTPPPPEDASGRIQNQGAGVARVPGCATIGSPNVGCANGSCNARGCGPNGCAPGVAGQWGANGSPLCRVGQGGQPSEDGFTFGNVGRVCAGAGYATTRAVNQAFGSMWRGPECDWNDETNGGAGIEFGQGNLWNGLCPEHGQRNCPHCCGWLHDQWEVFNCRNRQQGEILRAHIHGKLAYFHPMGNGGEGAPPFGCYHLVYAADPNYFDPRDAQVYAAQGWGVPMSVPLAPTVRHTMNYSAGIPASRLTPISNVVPPRGSRHW